MAGGEDTWWVYDDTAVDKNGSPAGGKRRLIREGGITGGITGQGSRSAPGSRRGSSVDCFSTTDEN